MQLLNLINGFPGAPSGTAEVFVSGSTASLATVYADAAGTATLTNPVVLDANGSATAYVDTTVDIVIKTSTGSIAKARYTPEGVDAMIETSGPSFTGANPVTGALAVNQPIGLDTVLDRWVVSAGAPDWKVRRTGQAADETLKAAFAAVTGANAPFFNVRSYGALGDGSTDDAAAFESAVAAAIAAGGGIVFVPGSLLAYVLSRTINIVSPRVSFLGAGPLASVLRISSTAALAWTGGVTTGVHSFCQGIGFSASSAVATSLLSVASCPGFVICMCRGSVSLPVAAGVFAVSCKVIVKECSFANPVSGTFVAIGLTSGTAGSLVQQCYLEATSGVAYLASLANDVTFDGCYHSAGAASAILITAAGVTGVSRVINCHAITGKWVLDNSNNVAVTEYNNTYFDSISTTATTTGGVGYIGTGASAGAGGGSRWGSRQKYALIAAGATYSPRTDLEVHYLTITAALAISAPLNYNVGLGDRVVFVIYNSTAGALNVTWNAAWNVTATPTSVTAGQKARVEFVFISTGWVALAAVQVFA